MGMPVPGVVVIPPLVRIDLPSYGGINHKYDSTYQYSAPSAATNTNAPRVPGSSSVLGVLLPWNRGVALRFFASILSPLVHKFGRGKTPVRRVSSTPRPARYAPSNPSIPSP